MREVLRKVFDEMWIIDLEGDNIGARKTENVFDIRTPVAIAVGVRYGKPQPDKPAKLWYCRITGTREAKLAKLAAIKSFNDLPWEEGYDEWARPLLPRTTGDFFSWPPLTDIFPWQHSGCQMKRTWPIAPNPDVLQERWQALLKQSVEDRRKWFKETRDHTIDGKYDDIMNQGQTLQPISQLDESAPMISPVPYGYRSFDRQWIIPDGRLGDFMRPSLWQVFGPRQIYLSSLLTKVLGLGPAAMVSAYVPDLDYFCGRGGKDVIPLWRDARGTMPNITPGLLDLLTDAYGTRVGPEDFLAYCYAILANPSYVERFSEELTIPGPRLPITKDAEVWAATVELGRRLVWLHTFGERMAPAGVVQGAKGLPVGVARCTRPVSGYPNGFEYDEQKERLVVGDGVFEPVSKQVFEFSISGFPVVRSWLDYRTSRKGVRKSSPLDDIQPKQWIFTEELLRLLWVLEETVNLRSKLDAVLDEVLSGPVWTAKELPIPPEALRRPPVPEKEIAGQLSVSDGLGATDR